MLKKKMKLSNFIRRVIQVVFFFTLPALYTSAFSGVKYIFRQMGAGAVIENNSFLAMSVYDMFRQDFLWLCMCIRYTGRCRLWSVIIFV